MTKAEAAKMIREDMRLHHDYLSGTYRKALKMAVKALEQNSINRQAAIDAAKDVCQTVLAGCKSHYDLELGDDIYDDINEIAVVLRYNKAILEALNKLPAVPDRVNQKSSHGCHYQNHGKEIPGNETSNI